MNARYKEMRSMSNEICSRCKHRKEHHMRANHTLGPCNASLIEERTKYKDEETGQHEKTGYMVSGTPDTCTCERFY